MGSKKSVFTNRDSICWQCSRATDGSCSWSGQFEPVDGWVAERTTAENHYGKDAYCVHECPQFAVYEGSEMNSTGAKRLAHAICAKAIQDYCKYLSSEKRQMDKDPGLFTKRKLYKPQWSHIYGFRHFNNQILALERWFMSADALMYMQDNDPVYIMKRVQKLVGLERP